MVRESSGCRFLIRFCFIEREKLKKVSADQEEKSTKDEFEYDIMISYCHADKELVHKIHRYLADQGFKIWIDQEQIYGPGNHHPFISQFNPMIVFDFSNASHG